MGREFYRQEAVFRETVQRCSRVVESCSGFSTTDYFTDHEWSVGGSVEETERRNIILLSVFELALFTFWRAQGIKPEAVAGVCSGEIAAAYSAGALTLEESAAVACSVAWLVTQRALKGHFITLEAEFDVAVQLSQKSQSRLHINLEISPVTTLGYCTATDFADVQRFLTQNGVNYRATPSEWPYHTPRSADLSGTTEKLYQVQPRPLGIGFYSALAGGLRPTAQSAPWRSPSMSMAP